MWHLISHPKSIMNVWRIEIGNCGKKRIIMWLGTLLCTCSCSLEMSPWCLSLLEYSKVTNLRRNSPYYVEPADNFCSQDPATGYNLETVTPLHSVSLTFSLILSSIYLKCLPQIVLRVCQQNVCGNSYFPIRDRHRTRIIILDLIDMIMMMMTMIRCFCQGNWSKYMS